MPEFGIITAVMPPGGWHFPQVITGGQSIRIIGYTFEQLLANMTEFRRRHPELCGGSEQAELERIRSDLKNYLCKHFPQNCADAPKNPGNPQGPGIGISRTYARPIDRAGDWLAQVTAGRTEKVEPALAASRAQICATCPMNIRWQTGCQPCNENVQVRTQNAKGSLHTPYDRNLFMCRAYGHVNEVAVWLVDTQSATEVEVPAICWKK